VSGLSTSKKFISAYLYKKRMIIRQKLSETTHQVRCCHCPKNTAAWGPYPSSYTTTSVFLRHFEKFDKDLPRSQQMEDEILSRLQNKRQRTENTPWSLATKARSGHRPPGESFNNKKYRKLLAAFIIETNSAFRIVESTGFNNLIQYCNTQAELISRHTVLRDIRNLHQELQPMIKAKLAAHTTTGGRVSLAWTSSNKVPYL
jgi:hypothetical protein